jgi:hypothetical protein
LAFELRDGNHVVSDDPARLDIAYVHAFLVKSYWSPGIPRDVVALAIAGSLSFSLYDGTGAQVGFARVITDRQPTPTSPMSSSTRRIGGRGSASC